MDANDDTPIELPANPPAEPAIAATELPAGETTDGPAVSPGQGAPAFTQRVKSAICCAESFFFGGI